MKSHDNLVITCDETIDTPDTVSMDSIDKKATHKRDYYIFHFFISRHIVINKHYHLRLLYKASLQRKKRPITILI